MVPRIAVTHGRDGCGHVGGWRRELALAPLFCGGEDSGMAIERARVAGGRWGHVEVAQ